MKLQSLMGHRLTRLAAILGLGLAPACADDSAGTTAEDPNTLTIAGFALSDDDESDDGFEESADTAPLEEELSDDLSDDLSEDAGEVPLPDETDTDPVPADGPDRIGRTVLFVWGQPELNPALADTPTTWKGRIWSDVASVHTLRAMRFERAAQGDHLVKDGDPHTVSFETVTTTHHDGLLVHISAPRNAASLEGEVSFETEHFTKTIPLRDLLAGDQLTFAADDLGNGLLVASALPHRCPHGLTRLHWERKNARGGVFGGKIYGDDGALIGKVVGLWGTVGGKQRMKGVFRGVDGSFKGTVRGAWSPLPAAGGKGGTFRGVWVNSNQVKGVVGGMFRVGDERGAGSAQGFWRAVCGDGPAPACGADLALPAPPAASCECPADAENDLDQACACDVPPPMTCVAAEEPVASE